MVKISIGVVKKLFSGQLIIGLEDFIKKVDLDNSLSLIEKYQKIIDYTRFLDLDICRDTEKLIQGFSYHCCGEGMIKYVVFKDGKKYHLSSKVNGKLKDMVKFNVEIRN